MLASSDVQCPGDFESERLLRKPLGRVRLRLEDAAGLAGDEVLDLVSVDQLGITNADQAFEIYQTVLPHTAAIDTRRRELVSKIVDERLRSRR